LFLNFIGESASVSTPARSNGLEPRRRSWQISLADLIVLVLAVGVSAGIARQARDAWGNRLIPTGISPSGSATGPWRGSPVPLDRTAGVVFEVGAIFLILNLARTLVGLGRLCRGREVADVARIAWPIAWRIVAIVIMAAFVADEAGVLRIDYGRQMEIAASRPGWGPMYIVRQNLLPIYAALAIVGLALGMGAGALFDNPQPTSHRPYWLFVPLVAVMAVLLAAETAYSIIVYILLVALEAVSNAMRYAPHNGPGLAARLLGSGRDASLALLGCLALALVVAHDFDRARRHLTWGTTRGGRFVRLVISLIAVGAGVYVATVSIPTIHPCLAQGFAAILGPEVLLLTVSGFGLFALGLAARVVVPRLATEQPAWLHWFSAFFRYGLLLVLWIAALKNLPASSQLPLAVPASVGQVMDAIGRGQAWAWSLLPYPVVVVLTYCLQPDQLQWIIAATFVGIVVPELTIARATARAAPFDAVFGSARSAIEVAWLTVALTLVCVVALPILVVLGQAVVNAQLNLEDWLKFGWPR
jgi:hypothetical protein